MDQTRFVTLQKGIEVAKDLELPEAERRTKGERFKISLLTAIPWRDGNKFPLDIIVDRVSTNRRVNDFKFKNGDIVVDTVARLEPDDTPFEINLMFHMELMETSGARVYVSNDMEKLIMARIERMLYARIERMLDQLLDP